MNRETALSACELPRPNTESTSDALPTTSQQPAIANYTIVDYIRANGIVETPVKRGDPGAPAINLPMPPGWEDAGPRSPEWA